MHLVKYPECGCWMAHREGAGIIVGGSKELYGDAIGAIAQRKKTNSEAISEVELREAAMTGKIGNDESSGIHTAVALCYIWVFGEKGQEYCLRETKNTIPGASRLF